MRIAIINETSAADKNADILNATEGKGNDIFNVGMRVKGADPELQYNHTGFLTALLLNTGRVDFVVGGCGTGQGYLNAAMQYPGVFCGHILTPLDAWLFMQINGGNCISLALNQGYGWAGNKNLEFIFERIFSVESGCGYPVERKNPQQASRQKLEDISKAVHLPFAEIVSAVPEDIFIQSLRYPGVLDILDIESLTDSRIKAALTKRLGR